MNTRTFQLGRRRHSGFTLIEVLATIALMAAVLPVAMKGVSICMAAASHARHQTEAGGLAQAKLAELIATQSWNGGVLAGDFGADWPEYRWEASVSAWSVAQSVNSAAGTSNLGTATNTGTGTDTGTTPPPDASANPPQQIDLKVTWRGKTGDQFVQLSTLVFTSESTSSTSSTTASGLP